VICSGARRGKQFTYALLDERAPQAKTLERDEALAELTLRYFTSHGPATVQDCAWWSGLTQADIRSGLASVRTQLVQESVEGKVYWHAGAAAAATPANTSFLLPAYDEYTVAYKDRSAILDTRDAPQVGSAVIDSVIVLDGQAVGNWKRTFDKGTVVITCAPFSPLSDAQNAAIAAAAQRHGRFLNMPVLLA
jgi:hypothetical protein